MPKRTYTSRTRGRSTSRPTKRSRALGPAPRFRSLLSKTGAGRAQSTRTKAIYCDWFSIDPATAIAGAYVFAANGAYDPNITGGGHQVNGFDQYMAFYGKYCVLASTITVHFRSADGTYPQGIGIFLCDSATVSNDWRQYVESGDGVWSTIQSSPNTGSIKSLSYKADIAKFSAQSIVDDDTYSGTVSTNPLNTHNYHVICWPVDNAANASGVQCQVEIRYDIDFREPILTGLS